MKNFRNFICILITFITTAMYAASPTKRDGYGVLCNPGTTIVNVSRLSNQEKVLFSNLITMTPGTFVIAVEGNNFLIHALNRNNLNFRNNYEITKLLKKMR